MNTDAKIGNMIIRNGKVAGFIDLDTIMTGSVFDDIADCVRSCCLNDEGNIENTEFMDLIRGYEQTSGTVFTLSQKDLIRKNIEKNRFLLGLRYYTAYSATQRPLLRSKTAAMRSLSAVGRFL